jgi:hypothetical protein
MATNDEDREALLARRKILWHQAGLDLAPLQHYFRASERVIEAKDVGRTLSDLLHERMNEIWNEFDPE